MVLQTYMWEQKSILPKIITFYYLSEQVKCTQAQKGEQRSVKVQVESFFIHSFWEADQLSLLLWEITVLLLLWSSN